MDGTITEVELDDITAIVPASPDGSLKGEALFGDPQSEKNRNRAQIALALLTVEHYLLQFQKAVPGTQLEKCEFVLFGSSTLTLTALPERISHDIDVAVPREFLGFLKRKLQDRDPWTQSGFEISIEPAYLLDYCGNWRQRSSVILGTTTARFDVLHPLDTVSQKLLRTDQATFERKDVSDIDLVLKKTTPSKETLLHILQEGCLRYSNPVPEEALAAKRNTAWFLKSYLPGRDLQKDVIDPWVNERRAELANLGHLPRAAVTPLSEPIAWEKLLDPNPPEPPLP